MESKEFALLIREILENKGADKINVLDVADMTSIADCLVIANGRNVMALHALADDLIEKLNEKGIEPRRTEGMREGKWIVIDYAGVIVHLFHPDEREYYDLDRLWANGTNAIL